MLLVTLFGTTFEGERAHLAGLVDWFVPEAEGAQKLLDVTSRRLSAALEGVETSSLARIKRGFRVRVFPHYIQFHIFF